ncbi:MAG: ferrochelatase [Rhodobacteraceae bacterium]|nr:ferrochelatase [Paracoccaceae bacterium]
MHHPGQTDGVKPDLPDSRVGILLINLGSPQTPDFWPVRRYLKEFLTDPRVIEARGPLWWLILNALVLTRRPGSLAHAYRQIWDHRAGESPLKLITSAQADRLADRFGAVTVEWAMRYGSPSIGRAIDRLVEIGCERILLFPLYPQYSAATTASAVDAAFAHLKSLRHQPAIRTVPPYFAHPAYISALADSVRRHIKAQPWQPDVVLVSFHGLPEAMVIRGDPYLDQCRTTFQLLGAALGMAEDSYMLAFQSNGGRGSWLGPFTDATIHRLAVEGTRNLVVVTPGFAADCLETLEEIGLRARRDFLRHGGDQFSIVPCLNASATSIAMQAAIVADELAGWYALSRPDGSDPPRVVTEVAD